MNSAGNPAGRLIVGISGASGVIYGVRALEILRERGCRTAFLGWTWLVEWYGKLGCQVWQEYIMPAPQLEREP